MAKLFSTHWAWYIASPYRPNSSLRRLAFSSSWSSSWFMVFNGDDEQGRINRVKVQIKNSISKIATDLVQSDFRHLFNHFDDWVIYCCFVNISIPVIFPHKYSTQSGNSLFHRAQSLRHESFKNLKRLFFCFFLLRNFLKFFRIILLHTWWTNCVTKINSRMIM